jgi:hypothetical protein
MTNFTTAVRKTHDVSQNALPSPCPRCGTIDQPAIGPGHWPHTFRMLCPHCGALLRWLHPNTPTQHQARLQAMAAHPTSPAQLAYLQALGNSGPPPATMAEVSARMNHLTKHGGVV